MKLVLAIISILSVSSFASESPYPELEVNIRGDKGYILIEGKKAETLYYSMTEIEAEREEARIVVNGGRLMKYVKHGDSIKCAYGPVFGRSNSRFDPENEYQCFLKISDVKEGRIKTSIF